jgi:hypothetical protein
MAKRILMVITAEPTGDLRSAARSAAAVARDSGGHVRMVFVRPIPPSRMDRYGRLVADPDAEMVRLAGLAEIRMAALGAEFGDVPVEAGSLRPARRPITGCGCRLARRWFRPRRHLDVRSGRRQRVDAGAEPLSRDALA